jgi:hypothetical protein
MVDKRQAFTRRLIAMRRWHVQSNRRTVARSSHFPASVGSTTVAVSPGLPVGQHGAERSANERDTRAKMRHAGANVPYARANERHAARMGGMDPPRGEGREPSGARGPSKPFDGDPNGANAGMKGRDAATKG